MLNSLRSLCRYAVATYLLTAVVLKAVAGPSGSIRLGEVSMPHSFAAAMSQVEFATAFGLIALRQSRIVYVAALILFALLSGASLLLAQSGASACGCFGDVRVSPWTTLALDLAAILLLMISWPSPMTERLRVTYPPLLLYSSIAALIGLQEWAKAPVDGVVRSAGEKEVLLQPQDWIGKKLPIYDSLQSRNFDLTKLAIGYWDVVLYRDNCPTCSAVIKRYTATQNRDLRTVFIRAHGSDRGPYNDLMRLESDVWLQSGIDWFFRAPLLVHLQEGVVVDISYPEE